MVPFNLLDLIVILSLPLLHAIETLTWLIRSIARPGQTAWVMTRTNLVLFFSRFFYLAFVTLMYYRLETGMPYEHALMLLWSTFLLSCLLQLILVGPFGFAVGSKVGILFGVDIIEVELHKQNSLSEHFIYNVVAVLFISLGIVLPILLAYAFPDQRLTLSISYQAMNALGTYVLLTKVDSYLSKKLDTGKLVNELVSYGHSRSFAFALIFLALLGVELLQG